MRPAPIYCRKCGLKLVPFTLTYGYNDQTGEPLKGGAVKRCPNCNNSASGQWGAEEAKA